MIVECPNCKTTYNLDDSLVSEGGRQVKCSVCEHRFHVESAFQDQSQVKDQDLEDLFGESGDSGGEQGSQFASALDSLNESAGAPAPAPSGKGGYEIPEDLASASAEELAGEEAPAKGGGDLGLDDGFSLDAKPKKKKAAAAAGGGKKKLVIGVAAGVVLLLVVAGALYFFKPGLLGLGAKPKAEPAAAKPVSQAQVENITLDKIRQYYVDNEKAGRLFVVEGVAVNDFDKPKELIAVEVGLFDAKGQMVASQRQMAGNVLSLYNLQIQEWDKIEGGLANESGIAANNTNIAPKGEVPFMVVMARTPESVSEFVVKVVEVKDPPKQ